MASISFIYHVILKSRFGACFAWNFMLLRNKPNFLHILAGLISYLHRWDQLDLWTYFLILHNDILYDWCCLANYSTKVNCVPVACGMLCAKYIDFFSDWMEFNPFEIGIAKYGAFMNTKHFGSKFIMANSRRGFWCSRRIAYNSSVKRWNERFWHICSFRLCCFWVWRF